MFFPVFTLFLTLKQTLDTIHSDYLTDVKLSFSSLLLLCKIIISLFMVPEDASAETDKLRISFKINLSKIYFSLRDQSNPPLTARFHVGNSGIHAPPI